MRTPAEIFKETIKLDGKPERQLKQYEALKFTFKDPIARFLANGIRPGVGGVDRWGTTVAFPEDAPGRTPIITEDNKVCPDITRWRDYVHAPDIETAAAEGDWSYALADAEAIRAEGKLVTILMGTGMFEQCHFLMGIEDTLVNFYEHPNEMHELIEYICEYRIKLLSLIVENLHPDVILSHDDWGTRTALFMQPDIWREFYKEPYRKFYRYMREHGVIAIHHADSYLVPIVEDMAEIGIQVWQGALPENDIPALLRQLNGRMTIMGGIGAIIDNPDTTETEARTYVRTLLEECCPYGHFIPCITYGLSGTINKHVDPYIDAEIDAYNSELHFARVPSTKVVNEELKSCDNTKDVKLVDEAGTNDILEEISRAIQSGAKSKLVDLCSLALNEGKSANEIIDKGLVVGMTKVGEAFSEGVIFVPEMLLAARAMSAALEILKPTLQSGGHKAKGKAVIGTIEGDLHDIGKNLVKVMLEGCGIEVIDLGSNVPADDLVNTAIEENCNIIACSSLISTTMGAMKKVVDIAIEKGIRERVTIMVGGAPVTQEFCDEIGADIYTADAGEAARKAVEALNN